MTVPATPRALSASPLESARFVPHVVTDPFARDRSDRSTRSAPSERPAQPADTMGHRGDDDLRVVRIEPWADGVHDVMGHDPRSAYVERFWLSMLGPSTTWLLRTIAYGFDSSPDGFTLDVPTTAHALGLAGRVGRHGVFMRALHRLCAFELAAPQPNLEITATLDECFPHDGVEHESIDALVVRRNVPWLSRRQVLRLPTHLRDEHADWERGREPSALLDGMRRRAARLAVSVVNLGEDVDGAERALLHWRFHPSLCREMAQWAWEQVHAES